MKLRFSAEIHTFTMTATIIEFQVSRRLNKCVRIANMKYMLA